MGQRKPKPFPDEDNDLTLTIGGTEYSGWENISVQRDLETVTGGFNVSLSDRFISNNKKLPFAPGVEAIVKLGKDKVMTGVIDSVSASFNQESRIIQVTGRDKTRELVDVSAELDESTVLNQNFEAAIKMLCEKVNIKVKNEFGSFTTIEAVTVNAGDSIFNVIDRIARNQGVLTITNAKGELVIAKVGQQQTGTDLEQGKNVLAAEVNYDDQDRFNTYIVRAQKTVPEMEGMQETPYFSEEATDSGISQSFRRKVILGEEAMTPDFAKKRAQWEAAVRAARALQISITVQGWREASGQLWAINKICGVRLPFAFVDADLLISRVNFQKSLKGGTTTTLTLTRKDAFVPVSNLKKEPIPLLEKK